MNKAIFLDRDGVINYTNENLYYVYKIEDFKINAGVIEFLQKKTKENYKIIIISNQSGIAKGVYSKKEVDSLHSFLNKQFHANKISITDILYCPHHPSVSNCLCRKPNSLLFEKAVAKYNINVNLSVMIGDSQRDILAAEKVGIKGIKIEKNQNLNSLFSCH